MQYKFEAIHNKDYSVVKTLGSHRPTSVGIFFAFTLTTPLQNHIDFFIQFATSSTDIENSQIKHLLLTTFVTAVFFFLKIS